VSEANKELVRRWVEDIFNSKDLDACDRLIAAEYVEHAVATFGRSEPGLVPGPPTMRQTAQFIISQFPDVMMTIESLLAEGDEVAVRLTARGTNRGPIGGVIPPTGRAFVASQCHWFRVQDGKLAEHWAVRDDLSAMIQLGVVRPPGAPQSGAGPRPDAPGTTPTGPA
jgi:predicted SnoaL-like aldol condensation-catalyzing enzyme